MTKKITFIQLDSSKSLTVGRAQHIKCRHEFDFSVYDSLDSDEEIASITFVARIPDTVDLSGQAAMHTLFALSVDWLQGLCLLHLQPNSISRLFGSEEVDAINPQSFDQSIRYPVHWE